MMIDERPWKDSPLPPFELIRDVVPADIDELGHVNNVVYLSWVQDVAVAHWNSLTTAAFRANLLWIALRHEIDYKAEAVLGDSILARTWTGRAIGLRYQRHTQILRQRDGVLLAQALTDYCPVNAQSRKPTRLTPDVAGYFRKG
jgi:acyl-CoA thioester hydrolase